MGTKGNDGKEWRVWMLSCRRWEAEQEQIWTTLKILAHPLH